jgi:hypothetical protein
MTLAELYRELEAHDWFHAMNDDARVADVGRQDWERLLWEAKRIEGGLSLFNGYSKYIFSGPAFGTPQAPRPEKPDELTGSQIADALAKAQKEQS